MNGDDFDKLLDKALVNYSETEMPQGLDQRVLRHVRTESAKPRFVFPLRVIAAASLACLIVAAVVFWRRPEPPPVRPEVAIIVPKPGAAPAIQQAQQKKTARKPRRPPLPKQEVFPTPSPMTEQERALLEFFELAPEQAREIVVTAEQRTTEPIQIKELTIQPLPGDELQ